MARRQVRKLHAPTEEERVSGDEQGVRPLASSVPKAASISRLVLALSDVNLQSDGACRCLHVSQRGLGG